MENLDNRHLMHFELFMLVFSLCNPSTPQILYPVSMLVSKKEITTNSKKRVNLKFDSRHPMCYSLFMFIFLLENSLNLILYCKLVSTFNLQSDQTSQHISQPTNIFMQFHSKTIDLAKLNLRHNKQMQSFKDCCLAFLFYKILGYFQKGKKI